MLHEKLTVKTREIPTGRGGELNAAMRENLLRFEKVKNKVILINPKLKSPFKIKEMALFAKNAFSEELHPLEKGEHWVEAWPEHQRSALVSRVIFGDEDGCIHRDTDIKGNGFVINGNTVLLPGKPRTTGGDYLGLREKDIAINEYLLSEKFHEAGIRTARILAISELEEIIVGGQKISLQEARKKWGLMDEEFTPVIEVRAFGTKARIIDVVDVKHWGGGIRGFDKENKNLLLEDAKKLVSQETGKDLMSNDNYAKWFAPTLGQNLGLMHKNGWVHHGLNKHNITLDCKIGDLGSVTKIDKSDNKWHDEISQDVKKALGSFYELVWTLDVGGSQFLEFKEQFFNNYNKYYPMEERVNFKN